MSNILRKKCNTNLGIYMLIGDDYLFVTKHWDTIVRGTFNSYPDRILLAYPEDPTCASGQLTHMFLSAEWINILGKFSTEYFPAWGDDTWLDQVSQMVQRKVNLNMRIEPQGGKGKTPRMKNAWFWHKFYFNLMDERIKDANLLRRAIYEEGSFEYKRSVKEAEKLVEKFIAEEKKVNKKNYLAMEKSLSDGSSHWQSQKEDYYPLVDYLMLENNAVNHLLGKVNPLLAEGKLTDVIEILDNILCASQKIHNIHFLKANCLKRLGRLSESEQAIRAELAIQPGDPGSLHFLKKIQA